MLRKGQSKRGHALVGFHAAAASPAPPMKKLRAGSSHADPPLRIGQSASPATPQTRRFSPPKQQQQQWQRIFASLAVIAAEADGLGRVLPGGAPAKEPAEAGAIGEAAVLVPAVMWIVLHQCIERRAKLKGGMVLPSRMQLKF
ncbi:hypothetical protein EMIHUDRAFT_193831 [Emiliania huxleyi CCMP1516]|uniref:Uncharacterized protein n=2 Tax=Emiliania huxleyi TaxID=2903 RepID=A0A0D3L0H6_EMIH1|nr:hypothetical protein EMIHUDRAFT_193831 [Emiliania huxleyi CCMP1516]EOD41511.1 hypothetical protein EMIHUDRAFT_193831 [Emiliania huxleyi CCMP1516]|eukprot:XP_005793940.1 hypothetical protein EMIHUDRAFT_193831 [Emiliania huxleyi CCMP1516]